MLFFQQNKADSVPPNTDIHPFSTFSVENKNNP